MANLDALLAAFGRHAGAVDTGGAHLSDSRLG